MAYELSLQCRQLGNFLYLSCDEDDVVNIPTSTSGRKMIFPLPSFGERNPSNVRGAATPKLEHVRKELMGSQVVFIISGLGGMIGSGIAPLIARCAKQVRAMVVGIVTMPFVFERHKHFFAGCALRQLTDSCDGIIMLENEKMLRRGKDDLSAFDANAQLYEKLSLAINSLIPPVEGDGTGIERVVDFVRANPYSVLQVNGDATPNLISEEAPGESGILISYHSRAEVDEIISLYDPVDVCLRRSGSQNLDLDFDSSFEFGQGILRDIEA